MERPDAVISVPLSRATWADVIKAMRAGALWAEPGRCAYWSDLADAIAKGVGLSDGSQERKG